MGYYLFYSAEMIAASVLHGEGKLDLTKFNDMFKVDVLQFDVEALSKHME